VKTRKNGKKDARNLLVGSCSPLAKAMLDVINDKELRVSLVARGYEYAEPTAGQRKKEYLDLIDSLSTELFGDIQFSLLSVVTQRQSQAAVPFKQDASELPAQIEELSSAPSVKGR